MMLALLAAAALAGGHADPYAAPAKYPIQIDPVRDMCLVGRADRSYWEPRLELEGLHPMVIGDRVEVQICTSSLKFMGLRFREGLVAVSTSREKGGGQRDGMFIVRAFNSRRFFAWVERVRNHSPYYRGEISDGGRGEHSYLEIREEDQLVFEARMVGSRAPSETRENLWEGPVWLPKYLSPKEQYGQFFRVRLEGPATFYPYLPGQDVLLFGSAPQHPVAKDLLESHFEATGWWVRDAGRHSKTDSMSR